MFGTEALIAFAPVCLLERILGTLGRMKVLIVLAAVLATVSCQVYRQPEPQQYAPIPYSFNYLAEGDEGTSGHQESGDGNGNVQGSYTVTDQDGRNRVVEYVADANGFRANVRTNEPGTDNSAPADVVFESTSPDARGPVIKYSNEAQQYRPQYNQPQPQYYNQPQPQYYNQPQPQYYNRPQ